MLSKKVQLYIVGSLVIITTIANCIRSTIYLSNLLVYNQQNEQQQYAFPPPPPQLSASSSSSSLLTIPQNISSSSSMTITRTMKEQEEEEQQQQKESQQLQMQLLQPTQLQLQQPIEQYNDNINNMNIIDTPDVITRDDFIYQQHVKDDFDSSPIILEKYKLVFITVPKVACTTWKMFFRRVMGYSDWQDQNVKTYMPHNPHVNGLKYLYHYPINVATEMMTSPEWTRAIFLRDPKRRFLSAFLDKVFNDGGHHIISKCCKATRDCVPYTSEGFLELIQHCHDSHWMPQYYKLPPRFWKYINFVGHLENVTQDAKRLLQQIGAWDEYGKDGWGNDNNLAIFEKPDTEQTHVTHSEWKVWTWFTPALERKVEAFYAMDYAYPQFQLPIQNLTRDFFISPRDKIWNRGNWDGPPIVIPKFKLVFFTIPKVGGTIWKMLFRRMEGLPDWNITTGGETLLPHNPDYNGLTYLNHYDIETASTIMTSPNWTRAIFVRNPKDRFLSVYNELRWQKQMIDEKCCPNQNNNNRGSSPSCSKQMNSLKRFLTLMRDCSSAHWDPQYRRMESKYWDYINFIGHIENAQQDAKELLQRLVISDDDDIDNNAGGATTSTSTTTTAWEEYGMSGWGPYGNQSIFTPTGHEMDSVRQAIAYYTSIVDNLVEDYYHVDYQHSELFHFPKIMHALRKG